MARCTGLIIESSSKPSKSSKRRCLARKAIFTVVRYRLLEWRIRLSARWASSLGLTSIPLCMGTLAISSI